MAWVALSPYFVVALVFSVLHCGVGLTLFLRNRDKFPISGHSIPLVVLQMTCVVLHAMDTATAGIVNGVYPCALVMIGSHAALLTYITCYLARAWRVWFLYLAAYDHFKRTDVAGLPGFKASKGHAASTRFIRYHHWFSHRNMFLVAVAVSAVLAAPPVISGTVLGAIPSFADGGVCDSLAVGELSVLVACCVVFIYMLFTWYKIRISKAGDNFLILKEQRLASLLGAWGAIIQVLTLTGVITTEINRVQTVIALNGLMFATLDAKLIVMYRDQRSRHGHAETTMATWIPSRAVTVGTHAVAADLHDTDLSVSWSGYRKSAPETDFKLDNESLESLVLSQVFTNERALELFVEHMKREFAIENVLFYLSVAAFRTACKRGMFTAEQRNRRAVEIFREFIHPDSDMQVHLKVVTQNRLLEVFKTLSPNVSENDLVAEPLEMSTMDESSFTVSTTVAHDGRDIDSMPGEKELNHKRQSTSIRELERSNGPSTPDERVGKVPSHCRTKTWAAACAGAGPKPVVAGAEPKRADAGVEPKLTPKRTDAGAEPKPADAGAELTPAGVGAEPKPAPAGAGAEPKPMPKPAVGTLARLHLERTISTPDITVATTDASSVQADSSNGSSAEQQTESIAGAASKRPSRESSVSIIITKKESLVDVPADIFDAAACEVFHLMSSDSFRRFKSYLRSVKSLKSNSERT